MPVGKYFKIGYGILLLFLIIYLGTLIDFLFRPFIIFCQTLFGPIILSGVLYYLFRPLVKLLHTKAKLPKGIAILLIYLTAGGLFTLFIYTAGPEIQKQFNSFVSNFPTLLDQARDWFETIQHNKWFSRLQEQSSLNQITDKVTNYSNSFISSLGDNIKSMAGAVTNAVITIVIIPFVLYYMLKEGEKAPRYLLHFLPKKQQKEGKRILEDMDQTLSAYIQGQIIVSCCVGVLVTIGYFIIGLDYPLMLGVVAMVTNVIPFIGPWIGTFPGVVVGLFDSPTTAILVIVVVVIAQQIESQIISPQVMGRKLSIHPLTIIFLLLAVGNFAGIVGMLLAIPGYAVAKVIVSHIWRLVLLRKKHTDHSS
ncbi:AI-2E family transporter [Bacillus atrophaeus]|uniref:AI-2E family transporter n=1 Tax=Bacillus atrophaeus TaxID=1452 RepID=UPI003D3566C1